MKRSILIIYILCWANAKLLLAQFNPAALTPETLRYRLATGAVKVGSATVTISREPGTIHIVESLSGLFEQTAIVSIRDDSSLQAQSTQVVISRANRYHELKLQYHPDGQYVTGEVQRPVEMGGSRVIDMALARGTIDLYAVPYLWRASSLALNKTFQLPLFNGLQIEKGAARAWVSRIESVITPAGTFACYRVETFLGAARMILNFDQNFPHRLIRQIFPELEVQFELEKVELPEGFRLGQQE